MFAVVLLIMVISTPINGIKIGTSGQVQQQQVMPIFLSETKFVDAQLNALTSFYSLSLVNQTFNDQDTLTISAVSDQRTFISIYVNVVEQSENTSPEVELPTAENADIRCSDLNVVACVLLRPQPNSVIYISVTARDPISYVLYTEKEPIQTLSLSANSSSNMDATSVKFTEQFTKVFALDLGSASIDTQQIIIKAQYDQSDNEGDYQLFTMRAGAPTSNGTSIAQSLTSHSLGAYAQAISILKQHESYLVVITGQIGLSINIQLIVPSSVLSMNFPTQYLYDATLQSSIPQIRQFSMDTKAYIYSIGEDDVSFGVYLEKLNGEGDITVYACDFSYTFNGSFSQTSFVIIPDPALTCEKPDLTVKISNVAWIFGYRITVEPYNSFSTMDETIFLNEERVQDIDSFQNPCLDFQIEPLDAINIQTQQNMSLFYSGNPANKKITFKTCDLNEDYEQQNCKSVQLQVKDMISQYSYAQNKTQDSSLKICTQSNETDNYFSLLVMPYPLVKTIGIDNQIKDVVSNGQTILYTVNTSKSKSVNTTLQIRVTLVNGDIYLYDNCSSNRIVKQGDQQDYNKFCMLNIGEEMWNLSASYNLTQIDPKNILFGIQGSAESLIKVVAYLDDHLPTPDPIPPGPTPQPQPTPTLSNLTDGFNNISLMVNESSIYIYKSHIIPYNISFSNSLINGNYCVEIFQSFSQLESTPICSNSTVTPKQSSQYLWEIVYLRISQTLNNQNPNRNLSINILVPKITMQKGQSIYLSCNEYCYSDIKLKTDGLGKNIYVNINGPGYINSTPSTQQRSLTFSTAETFSYFTANLPEGGDLYIQINEDMPLVASWNDTEIDMTKDYSLFIVPIGTYSSYETLSINSFGTRFSVFKKLFMLNTSQSNILIYNYASNDNQDAKFYSSPKFNTPVVPLILPTSDDSTQQIPKQCFYSFYYKCFLAFTLIVQQNNFIMVEYDNFHMTTNSLVQYLSLNTFDVITSTFGVTYFSTLDLKNTRQGFNQNNADWDTYQITNEKVNVRPLSSCGTLEVDLIKQKFANSQQMDDENIPSYLSVLSTDSCVYSVGISSCQIPLIQSGVIQELQFSKDIYSGLYSSLSGSNSFTIGVWKNQSVELGEDQSYYPQLVVSVYLLNDQQNCSAGNGALQTTFKLGLNQQIDIYQTSLKQSLVSIPVEESNDGKLFLIQIQAVNSGSTPFSLIPLTMQITSEQANSVLLPNRDPIPILTKSSTHQTTQTFNYYTNVNQWQLCFQTATISDSPVFFNISVLSQEAMISNANISHQESGKCLNVSNGKKQNHGYMAIYTVVIIASYQAGSSSQGASTLWVWTKQSVQSIPLSQQTLIYNDPQQVLSLPTNGKYGKCYAHTISTKGQQITMIVYLNQSSEPGAMTNISIPNNNTKANITAVVGSKHGNVVGYRVYVTAHKTNEAVDMCLNTNQPYYLTIAEESEQYNLILQDETVFKHTGKILGQLKSLQIYKFMEMHAPKKQNPKTRLLQESNDELYLITELVQCTGNISNFTLLGSTSIPDIIFIGEQQFDKTFSKYNIMAGITKIQHGQEFYIGVKYDGDQNANYSLRTYTVNTSQIPQAKWSLSSAKLLKSQSKGDDFITVQLPVVNTSNKSVSSHSSVKYTVYIAEYLSNANTQSEIMVKCPGLQQLKNIKIYNQTMQNPAIPLFKLKINNLPSRNISIYATATVRETPDAVPFTYFYESDSMEVQADQQGHDSGKNINLILIFILLGIAIFLVLLFRFITKVIRKRKQRGSLSFQLSPPQNTDQNPQPAAQPNAAQDVNYGEFVQETA